MLIILIFFGNIWVCGKDSKLHQLKTTIKQINISELIKNTEIFIEMRWIHFHLVLCFLTVIKNKIQKLSFSS